MRKFSHWIEAFHYARPYTLKVYVKADKTTYEVECCRTKTTYVQRDLPFDINIIKTQIGKATGLKDYELDLSIVDRRPGYQPGRFLYPVTGFDTSVPTVFSYRFTSFCT